MKHEEQLMRYAARQLDEVERLEFEKHLAGCPACQADLELWKMVAAEIVTAGAAEPAPAQLAERALAEVQRSSAPGAFLHVIQLLHSQTLLVQREMWPATAAVMALGVTVALISHHAEFIYFVAPLIAAASLSMLFGPEHDPAYELVLATPASSWKLLLARLTIVSGYNLLLALAGLSILMLAFPPGLLGTLVLGLLAPMAFLSALALLLSIWLGTSNAIVISYSLWSLQFIAYQSLGAWLGSPALEAGLRAYRSFWQSPMLLLAFSVPLVLIALWSAGRPALRLSI